MLISKINGGLRCVCVCECEDVESVRRGRGAGFRVVGAQPCREIRSCGIVELREKKKAAKTDGYRDCVCACVCLPQFNRSSILNGGTFSSFLFYQVLLCPRHVMYSWLDSVMRFSQEPMMITNMLHL